MLPLLLACATAPVTWKVHPDPVLEVDTTRVAVAADSRECREVADALIETLGARPGVRIDPAATTSLLVTDCAVSTQPTVEVQHLGGSDDPMAPGFEEQRRVVVDGQGSARVVVTSNGVHLSDLSVKAIASEASPWSEDAVPAARVYAVDQEIVDQRDAADLRQHRHPRVEPPGPPAAAHHEYHGRAVRRRGRLAAVCGAPAGG